MIRKFKFFFNPITGLTKWLNEMSMEGYRLVKVGNTFYYFGDCEKGKYKYAVDFVANKSLLDLKDYERFLDESNIRYMEKSGNIGKVSIGSVRYRPYADKGAKLATSNGMINREYLILEKENDGKPFEIYTNVEDKITALKLMRKPTITMVVFIGLMLIAMITKIIPQYSWTFYRVDPIPEINKIISPMILSVVEIVLIINLIRFNLEIKDLKEKNNLME